MDERHDRLRKARIAAGYKKAMDAIRRYGFNENSYRANENGNAPFSFDTARDYAAAFKVRPEWLYAGTGSMRDETPMVQIVGRVGANPDGSIVYVTAHDAHDFIAAPPGASSSCAAWEVVGDSQLPLYESGSILFTEVQITEPSLDMINGPPAIVETEDGQVLLKTIQRAREPGLWDLTSLNAPPIRSQRLRWAAEVEIHYSPSRARKLVQRAAEAA